MQGPLLPGMCGALCMSRPTEADVGKVQLCVSDVNVGMDNIIRNTYLCKEKSVFLNPSWTPECTITVSASKELHACFRLMLSPLFQLQTAQAGMSIRVLYLGRQG